MKRKQVEKKRLVLVAEKVRVLDHKDLRAAGGGWGGNAGPGCTSTEPVCSETLV